MNEHEEKETVAQVFTEYLKANKMRCTPERLAILDAIYSIKGHFETEELLQELLQKSHFRVSRATVYNTINLLHRAKLVTRHSFGNKSQYERSYNTEPHSHLICTRCGKITEWSNDELRDTLLSAPAKRFSISSFSLYLYGVCQKCQNAKNRKNKKKTEQK